MSTVSRKAKGDVDAAAKEAFKVLRANIKFLGVKGHIKTLTITSSRMNEGKTSVSINLSIAMAEAGMKVLYIDADLRKASTVKHVSCGMERGLSNLLSEGVPMEDVLFLTPTENLYCIASGPRPPNPTELVETEEFVRLLGRASESFDMVIVDTPPLGTMIDAAIIAEKTDGAVIVVEASKTDLRSVKRVREQLEKASVRILGVVLNKVAKKDSDDYYVYYNYHERESMREKRWLKKLNIFRKVSL